MFRYPLLAVVLALSPLVAQAEVFRSISVSGTSEISVAPDTATLRLGVVTQGKTAQAALSENAATVEKVLAEIKANGINPEDIQTSTLSLNPVYDYDTQNGAPPELIGYSASNIVSVNTSDLLGLGAMIALANEAGANQVQGLTFGLQDKSAFLNEARLAAVTDARMRAELYAGAANVELGDIVTLSETGTGYNEPPIYLQVMEMRSDKAEVPISAGEITITASVEITYAIK